ncbi:MAG: hypothetical protein KatS3mg108_2894 [Isosphaeraceae bacterium]|jgi:phosphatidylglycerol:prolipoprotein diacylglycerol transferase|nr:MAG: hypothetical protein KatS3mg108_2894 [Isosphaeraceae bacterium]
MHPVLFQVPNTPLRIHSFGVMLCLAFAAAISMAVWRARRQQLDPEAILDLALWAVLGGLVGARAFYVVEYWGKGSIRSWPDVFKIWEGGIVFYGGLFGGALACLAYAVYRRLPILRLGDVIAPSLALGLAIGRIGCFLNGCCYGDTCSLPWAVRFPAGSAVWWNQALESVENPGQPLIPGLTETQLEAARSGAFAGLPRSAPVHPTQLYSAIDGLILCLVLNAFFPVRGRDGRVLALFLLLYPISRSLIEYLRNDEPAVWLGLTISQVVSLGIFLSGCLLWVLAPSTEAGPSEPAS